ncbi:hypothetical protein Tco_1203981 [Tanacetum coccineum]
MFNLCMRNEIDENLRFIEEPIEIVERDVKKLKRRRIPLVKVRWNSRKELRTGLTKKKTEKQSQNDKPESEWKRAVKPKPIEAGKSIQIKNVSTGKVNCPIILILKKKSERKEE